LLARHPNGFLLYGHPASGKSTLLQSIALRQVENVLRRPQSEKIPIFCPVRLGEPWRNRKISDQLWELVRRYSKLKRERLDQWLGLGRLVVIFDGLDESAQPEVILQGIKELKAAYPNTVLIASCRSNFLSRATSFLDLQLVELLDLTEDETAAFIRLLISA
jgi:predicted NACHT family NTPase